MLQHSNNHHGMRNRLVMALVILAVPVLVTAAERTAPDQGSWLSVLPPVAAIAIALITRAVIPALLIGIWSGVFIAADTELSALWSSLLRSFDTKLVNAIADPDRVRVLLFTMMLGGMIGVLAKNGGMRGIVARVTSFASNAIRGQLVTAGLGLVIFFDDVANTLLIGKTMRPVTDSLRISREKLAYLVDSTAAPIAGIAFASTWVGYEVAVIGSTVESVPGLDTPPYLIFLNSIPYSFYSIITLFMVFAVAATARDFGPMYAAELRAREQGLADAPAARDDEGDEVAASQASNALVPIIVVVVTLMVGLMVSGEGDNFRDRIGSADSYGALMWASLLGVFSAVLITVWRGILNLEQAIEAWSGGVRHTVFAVVVLTLSWTLADVVKELETAQFIIRQTDGLIPLFMLPAISFLLGGIVAFTTGTSWGTMGILMPLMLPLSWSLLTGGSGGGQLDNLYIFHGSVAGVLAGAIWGDHCSPISDTTVLSSLASDCHHIEHVRTQLPYAMTSGGCALLLCALPVGLGVPWWLCLLVSFAAVYAVLRFVGRPT